MSVRRVSDRPRNPANAANAEQLTYIEQFKAAVAAGDEIEPVVVRQSDRTHWFYPITTNAMCLQCHGPAGNLQPELLAVLQELYPNDRGLGYAVDQVRGIWSISFAD